MPVAVVHGTAPHRLAVHHHIARHHGHGAGHGLVAPDHGAVAARRPVPAGLAGRHAVDAVVVDGRVAVVGRVPVARRQRHPADRGPADVDADADVATAHPGHQRRCVNRPCGVFPRAPAPTAAPADPTAIVEGCKAPACVVHPGPPPRAHPGPATIAVGRPAGLHLDREPDRTVLGVALPAAVAVQVFGAGHLGRDVSVGRRALFVALVVACHPFRKRVAGQLGPGKTQAATLAPEFGALAGFQDEAFGIVDAQRAAQDAGLGAVVDTVEAVVAGTFGAQARFGGGHLNLGRGFACLHAQRQAAGVQLEDHAFVVQAHDFELGVTGHPQHGGTDAQLGAALRRGGQPVAAGQRAVALRFGPGAGLVVEPGHAALQVGQAADAAGWIVLRACRVGADGRQGQQEDAEGPTHERSPCEPLGGEGAHAPFNARG